MAEYITEVNQDYSIDIPTEVRDRLTLEPGDKLIMRFDNAEEHLVVGKLPMDAIEKAREIDDALGREIPIKENRIR
ncbi:MAG: hypothetical protein CVU89_08675 [Firmicutes bacterium HGW-Firmicutes-14]|nr:MAG: hypothetical protein CVU89_08675 [Firmicutes bacterium HGW-Firmicutes-14]